GPRRPQRINSLCYRCTNTARSSTTGSESSAPRLRGGRYPTHLGMHVFASSAAHFVFEGVVTTVQELVPRPRHASRATRATTFHCLHPEFPCSRSNGNVIPTCTHHRSEEHTSDSSHLGISYAVFCL